MKLSIAVVVLCLMSCALVRSQTYSTRGTDFWLTFMQNSSNPTRTIFIAAQNACSVTVSLRGRVIGSANLPSNGSRSFEITDPLSYLETSNQIHQNAAIRVQSTAPISVYAYNSVTTSTDAASVIPTPALGRDYRIASYPHYYLYFSRSYDDWSGLFALVGVEQSTIVEIIPRVPLSSNQGAPLPANKPFRVTLNTGDVVQFKTYRPNDDLTGSTVTVISSASDCGKVAVFSGHQRTSVPIENERSRDHLFEQIPPVTTLGKEYIVPPLYKAEIYDVRVIASEANTTVNINGRQRNMVASNSFLVEEGLDAGKSCSITADKPIMVVLYAQSAPDGWQDLGAVGDPMMIVLPPVSQRINNATIYAFIPNNSNGWTENTYVTLLTKKQSLPSLTYDGYTNVTFPRTLGEILLTTDAGKDYVAIAIRLRPGVHTFDAESNGGLLALVHGLAEVDSYGFVAGAQYQNLRTSIITSAPPYCPGQFVRFQGSNTDSSSVISWQWVFHDGRTATGRETARQYTDTGLFQVKLIMQRQDCGADTAYTVVAVRSSIKVSIHPKDTVLCVGEESLYTATISSASGTQCEWTALDVSGIVGMRNESIVKIRHDTAGVYRYQFFVKDTGGCSFIDTLYVRVIPGPLINVPSKLTICKGDIGSVKADVRDSTPIVRISWQALKPTDTVLIVADDGAGRIRLRGENMGDYVFRVTATNQEGCSSTAVCTLSVVSRPVIQVDSQKVVVRCIDDGNGFVEIGKGIVIQGGDPPYSFTWTEMGGGTASIVGLTNSLVTQVSPKRTTAYVLTVTGSRPGTVCATTIDIVVEVRPTPDANAGPDQRVCACDSMSTALIGVEAKCGRPPYTYTWNPPLGVIGTPNPRKPLLSVRPDRTTDYVLTVVDAEGNANTDTVTIQVVPCPNLTIDDVEPRCFQDTVYSIVGVVNGDTSGMSFQWSPTEYLDNPNSLTTLARLPNLTFTRSYTLRATNALGCSSSMSVNIRHSTGLTIAANASRPCSAGNVCRGDSVMLSCQVQGGYSPSKVNWFSSITSKTGWSSDLREVWVQPLETQTYYVSATDSLGCEALDSVSICVDPVPNVNCGSDTSICHSDRLKSRIRRGDPSTCGKPPFIYKWTPSNLVSVDDSTKPWSADLYIEGTTTYLLTVTDDGGRGNTTSKSITVTVRDSLVLNGVQDSLSSCIGSRPASMSIDVARGVAPFHVTVMSSSRRIDSGSFVGSYEVVFDSLATIPGRHVVDVVVVDAQGCEVQKSLVYNAFLPPSVEIRSSRASCVCDTVVLEAIVTPGSNKTGSYRYLWSEISETAPSGTITLSSLTDKRQTLRVRHPTRYSVTVTDDNGCSATTTLNLAVRRAGVGAVLSIDSIKADPRNIDVAIPVRVLMQNDTNVCLPSTVSFSLSYRRNLYDPYPTASPGVVMENDTVDVGGETWRRIVVSVPRLGNYSNNSIVTTIHGRALVGAPGETPLILDDAQFIYPCDSGAILARSASLVLDRLCVTGDSVRRLLRFDQIAILSAYPNPVRGEFFEIDVRVANNEPFELDVADVLGRVIYHTTVDGHPAGTFRIRIPSPSEAGYYRCMVHSLDCAVSSIDFLCLPR